MYRGKRIVAIIPARGGSSVVPHKNIRSLAGRPLVAHAVACSRAVPEIDLTVVSTDDAEIENVSRGAGAQVIRRPAEISGDSARTEAALLHAMDVLEASGESFDVIATLEPTSPLRSAETVGHCLRRFVESGAEAMLTVRETRVNLGRLVDGVFVPLAPGGARRRQDRSPLYVECGVVYLCGTEHLRRSGNIFATQWLAEPVSAREALDINTEVDFLLAEALFERKGE